MGKNALSHSKNAVSLKDKKFELYGLYLNRELRKMQKLYSIANQDLKTNLNEIEYLVKKDESNLKKLQKEKLTKSKEIIKLI